MKRRILALFALLSAMLLMPQSAQALGDLTITPWRVVFQSRDRSASVELLNTSNSVHTYRIGWTLLKATKEGRYEQIPYDRNKDKDPHSVPNMLIVSPRQVAIEPHGDQIVRLSLRRPPDLPPGEYRAHLMFIRMADERPEAQDPHAKTISMSIKVNLGFSIPVIVRQGEDKALKVSLQSPKLKPGIGGAVLDVDLHRDAGTFSSYGTVSAYWKPPKGSEVKIGELSNIALYPEVPTRHLVIPLLKKYNIVGGFIRIAYTGNLEADGITWDEKTFPVGTK